MLNGDGRRLRDDFKMRRWLAADEDRRNEYFAWVRMTFERLGTAEGDAPVEPVQRMLAIMIEEDDDFSDHCADQAVADRPWKELRLVCAGMIIEAYIRENEG